MHVGLRFSLRQVLRWTRREIYMFLLIALVPTVLYEFLGQTWIAIPWLPVALLGTAVAFLVGFKNNASYDRLWEARKIWGAIVNSSRSWALMARDFVSAKYAEGEHSEEELKAIRKRLIYRHVAWLTALRHQLRQPRAWESMQKPYNAEYKQYYPVPEETVTLEDDLDDFLSNEDKELVLSRKNRATQIIGLQSKDLKDLHDAGLVDSFRHVEMQNLLTDLFTQQGKCERIKNFPYPRQFATLNVYFVRLFILLLPFGMLNEFKEMGECLVWLTIPFTALVAWVFHTMEKIGEATENPFEGGANDIPMANLSRTIEIDLRELIDETDLPEPTKPVYDILM